MCIQKASEKSHIFSLSHKRRRYIVHVLFDTEEQILLILFTEVIHLEGNHRYVYTLVIAYSAAMLHTAFHLIVGGFQHPECNFAIIYKHSVSFIQLPGQVLICNSRNTAVSFYILCCESKKLSVRKLGSSTLKISRPYFRALGIQHYSSRNAQSIPYFSESVNGSAMSLMGTM